MPKAWNSQAAHDTTSNNRLSSSNNQVDDGNDPNDLPITPLHGTGVSGWDHVHAHDANERPVQCVLEHGVGIVEIRGLRAADGKRPVE